MIINVLDYKSIKIIQHVLGTMFQCNTISIINKPTRLTRNTATAIDHIITNNVISGIQHRSRIIISDIADHIQIALHLTHV